jgi:hypothetical protein
MLIENINCRKIMGGTRCFLFEYDFISHLPGIFAKAKTVTGMHYSETLLSSGNLTAMSRKSGFRPVALRPTLSDGLPFSVNCSGNLVKEGRTEDKDEL